MAIHSENGCQKQTLPPLILHPFAKAEDTQTLIESSRIHLALIQGPNEDEDTIRRLVACRYHEVRMLYYVGKDLFRWMDQCVDFVNREPELAAAQIRHQSFADFLVSSPPAPVNAKLRAWGVADSQVLFARAIGLRAVFADLPALERLSLEFLRHYHRYADGMFASYCQSVPFSRIEFPEFSFELYASGEYSRLLEENWS